VPTVAEDVTLVPFISQITVSPLCASDELLLFLYCHRMSALPLPSKSPVVIACQLGFAVPMLAEDVTLVPFINQITVSPLSASDTLLMLLYCHRMSDLPSPLKSPVVTTCQLGFPVPMLPEDVTLVPFISQITVSPLCVSDA